MRVGKGIPGFLATLSIISLQPWVALALEMPPNLSSLRNPEPQTRSASVKPVEKQEKELPSPTALPYLEMLSLKKSQPTDLQTKDSPSVRTTVTTATRIAAEKPLKPLDSVQNVYQGKAHQAVYQAEPAVEVVSGTVSSMDIMRSVPLEIKSYPAAKSFPEHFSSAVQVIQAIDSTPNLLVHMEALRRGYRDLDESEKQTLLTTLFDRHRAAEDDMMHSFNHGYAQLLFKNNKTGLFFLRKANDRFRNQFSSLAYGMAQAEADITLEASKPEEMTTRKMDAMYKLADAVQYDSQNHQSGFWPSYLRVLEKLKPLPAYSSFSRRDFSLVYLPYGNSIVPMRGAEMISIPLKNTPDSAMSLVAGTSCDPALAMDSDTSTGNVVSHKTVNLGAGTALIQLFSTDEAGLYRVRVTSSEGQPLLSFKTYARTSLVEDLDGDGTLEIVARQYNQDPLNPVLVYRYTPCGFEPDKKIMANFH